MIKAAWDYAILALGIALLAVETFLWGVIALVLLPLLPADVGRRWGRRGAMWGFRIYLGAMEALGAWRLDLGAIDELRDAGPLIVAPNHPGLLDAVLIVSRLPNAVCVMKGALLGNFLLGPAARLARYVRNDSLLRLAARAGDELRAGGQLLLFPEGTRSSAQPIGPLTDAVGALSRRARVPVQALLIETPTRFLGKGWPLLARPNLPLTFTVKLGRRFDPPQDVRAFTAELDRYFRRELAAGSKAAAREENAAEGIEGASSSRG
jgi:1-acyl-sn-glycerol-3-phosphate acyltransferase